MNTVGIGRSRRFSVGTGIVLATLMLVPSWALARNGGAILRNEVSWTYAGDLNFHLGRTTLDDSEWQPVEEQTRFGAEIDWTNSQHWTGVVMGFFYANENETQGRGVNEVRVDTEFIEVNLGLRKIFYQLEWVRPFLGVGGSLFSADVEFEGPAGSDNDNDLGFGGYGELGLYIDLYGPFHLGAMARYSGGRVELFGSSRNPGGLTVTGMIGTHWVDF